MKDAYNKAQRRLYNQLYRHKLKAPKLDLIGPPLPRPCHCGRLGYAELRGTAEYVCPRCVRLEKLDFHTHSVRQDQAIARNISPAWLLRRLQAWQEGINTWIEDKQGELVVHGHGEYHLRTDLCSPHH